jgi:hypothetical protein
MRFSAYCQKYCWLQKRQCNELVSSLCNRPFTKGKKNLFLVQIFFTSVVEKLVHMSSWRSFFHELVSPRGTKPLVDFLIDICLKLINWCDRLLYRLAFWSLSPLEHASRLTCGTASLRNCASLRSCGEMRYRRWIGMSNMMRYASFLRRSLGVGETNFGHNCSTNHHIIPYDHLQCVY